MLEPNDSGETACSVAVAAEPASDCGEPPWFPPGEGLVDSIADADAPAPAEADGEETALL
ncbi:hypothetical protein DLJ54_00920 [Corynebacterium heidelbergense]|uniref:Uncharacterized protein n=1 Tax=Corynebacterium heidelbergense TaxID=2055947 RepID=A0A364V8N6_9CORY|nr:hypothetical protein DLJ54_00920 [Corynebacterium heidelbergense]